MELRLLGSVELLSEGRRIDPGPAKQRCVLAVLGVSAGTAVPAAALIDRVWGEDQPRDVRNVLYTYVARLRRLLAAHVPAEAAALLRREPGGYLLDLAPEQIDLHRFQARLDAAGRSPDDDQRADLLLEALAEWRGAPLSGLPGKWADSIRARLEQLRVGALVDRFDIALRGGRLSPNLIAELTGTVNEYPAVERLAAQLMLAQYRAGRAAEALTAFERLRRHLADEYGHDPAVEVKTLHRRILRQDPALTLPRGTDKTPVAQSRGPDVPRQLPIAPATLVGRQFELSTVSRTLAGRKQPTPPIVAIYGPGGVGKSALALSAAHAVAEHYPDGQIYIDLQGSSPGTTPLSPIDALNRMLRSIGLSSSAIPSDAEEAAAEFRSRLTGRRILLVLDNAADAGQVRLLLPAHAGCAVLVTSRSALAALGDATHVRLSVLHPTDSIRLLGQLDRTGRLAADPKLGAVLAGLCGHLPLALRIAGARMTSRPDWPLERFVQRLSDEQHRLDQLGDENLSVRACFEASYRTLAQGGAADRGAARAFRLLGLPDGPDISLPLAARLFDRSEAAAELALERLIDAQLLLSPGPGRYRMHDLIRLYARELAQQELPEPERWAALDRSWRCYLATTARANQLLRPGFRQAVVPPEPRHALPLADRDEAKAWFHAELPNLLAAARQALGGPGQLRTTGIHLAHALFTYMHVNAHWKDLPELDVLALEAARATGDRDAEAQILSDLGVMAWMTGDGDHAISLFQESLTISRPLSGTSAARATMMNLGMALSERGEYERALRHLEQALKLHRAADYRSGEALSLNGLAQVNQQLGRTDTALAQLHRSLEIYRELGDRWGQAFSLRYLGHVFLERGEASQAQDAYDQALAISREIGDEKGAVWVLVHLATIHRLNGDPHRAVRLCQEALEISRRTGGRQEQGLALWRLGTALTEIGAGDRAYECWREALPIFERLGTPEADEIRRLLQGITPVRH